MFGCSFRTLLVGLLLFFAPRPALAQEARAPGVLMVSLGGYLSCPFGRVALASQAPFLREIERSLKLVGREYKQITSCFDFDPAAANAQLKVHYMLHDTKKKAASLKLFLDELADEINSHEDFEVYLVGHSHGGWSIMELLRSGRLNKKIHGLYTVDPISKTECVVSTYFQQMYGSLWEKVDSPSNPCTRFPQDMVPAEQEIRDGVIYWKNIYQVSTPSLHSGPGSLAENTVLNYALRGGTLLNLYWSGHVEIWTDRKLWDLIRKDILRDELLEGIVEGA